MRAEKPFGCLAAVTIALLVACRPAPRAKGDPVDTGGSGGGDPAGGTSGKGGTTRGVGGATGGTTGQGGTGSSAGNIGGDTSASGGTTSSGGTSTAGGTTGSGAGGGTGGAATCSSVALPTSFSWSTGKYLMDPVSDGGSHQLAAIEDPSLVFYNGRYHLYATVVANASGSMSMNYTSFTDFASSGSATTYYMDYTAGFTGSRYNPQLFYFSAQKKWYLITQSSGPSYSTATDPTQPGTWTKPIAFFSSTPSIVTQNAGSGGVGWTDFWVVCDTASCYLFFTNQNNYLFRSQTAVGSFPNGFGPPVVVMQGAGTTSLYASSRVYKVGGTGKYLLIAEAIGSKGRYMRSWTATALDSSWTALADTEANPFAGASNVTPSGSKWTTDISSGEIVRSGYDETMTISPCNLRYLFQGRDPYSTAGTALLPWKLGLLTQTD
jgi:endo-1,4-beta-xylanase